MKKLIVPILAGILLFLLIGVVQAGPLQDCPEENCDLGDITNPRPNITIVFSEEGVTGVEVTLNDSADNSYILEELYGQSYGGQTTFLFQPTTYLPNDDYTLYFRARDSDDNLVMREVYFSIAIDYMDIWVVLPELGIANTSVFNVSVATEYPSACKYGVLTYEHTDLAGWFDNLLYAFEEFPVMGTRHSITNFNITLTDGEPRRYVVICNQTGRLHQGVVYLGYDTTTPTITISASPNPVEDPGFRQSTVSISTDDDSLCQLSHDGAPYTNLVPYDLLEYDAFRKKHNHTISYNSITAQTPNYPGPWWFDANVTCINRAGFENNASHSIKVFFNTSLDVFMLSPRYTNKKDYRFELQTSLHATCTYLKDEVYEDTGRENYTHHYVATTNLADGDHSISVRCEDTIGSPRIEKTFTVTVDSTAPSKPTIDVDDLSCSLDKLSAEFEANDTGTGILGFNYSIKQGSTIIEDWDMSPKNDNPVDVKERKLDLENGKTYTWHVKAVDRAGNTGSTATANIKASHSGISECDTEPPQVRVRKIKDDGGIYINLTCQDEDSECADDFLYGLDEDSGDCDPDERRDYDDLIFVEESIYFCYDAYDVNDNHKTGIERIRLSDDDDDDSDDDDDPQCSDGEMNGDETDIDCGGNCAPCEVDQNCIYDIDCETDYCADNQTCQEPSCTDSMRNQDETDVDCGGGICTPCAEDKQCVDTADCVNGLTCYNNVCSTDRSKDTDLDGLPDYWEEEHFGCAECADPEGDADGDGFSNLEEYYANTDPQDPLSHPEKEKVSIFVWILLILGIILVLGGAGYLVYDQYRPKEEPEEIHEGEIKLQNTLERNPTNSLESTEPALPLEDTESYLKKKQLSRNREKKKLLSAFDEEEKTPQKETKNEEEKSKDVLDALNSSDKEKKSGVKKEESVSEKEVQKETSSKKSTGSGVVKGKDVKKDVFQELDKLAKTKPVTAKKTKSKSGKPSKGARRSGAGASQKKEEQQLTNTEIFDRLASLSGRPKTHIKKVVQDKKKLSRKDMMSIFANVSDKAQINTDVFKAILSTLLSTQKISKQTVSDVLFEFLDQELLSKKEVTTLMKELGLI